MVYGDLSSTDMFASAQFWKKMLYSLGDQRVFIFPAKTHVVEKIEIIMEFAVYTHMNAFGIKLTTR